MSRWFAIVALLLLTLKAGAESFNSTAAFTDRVSSSPNARLKSKSSKDLPDMSTRGSGAFKLGSFIDNILLKNKDASNTNLIAHHSRDLHGGVGGRSLPGVMAAVGRNSMARSLLSLMGPFMLGAIMTAPLIAPSAILAMGALGPMMGVGGAGAGIFRRRRDLRRSLGEVEHDIRQQMKRILGELDEFLDFSPKDERRANQKPAN